MIRLQDITAHLWTLQQIGRGPQGMNRLAWTPAMAKAEEWFRREAKEAGLRFERDAAGNLWACPPSDPPWWGVGSHLDTVRRGGVYDGALGVAAGFEIARLARVPIAVLAFADEEGARFNTPTFGSRALVGRPNLPLDRTDDDGVTLGEALTGAGLDPDRIGEAESGLHRLKGFLELHIDQSREIARMGIPGAPVSRLASRCRARARLDGRANHSGTTPMDDRSDALVAAARLLLAAVDAASPDMRVTGTRIVADPNALSTIPGRVDLWLDARAPDPAALDAWLASLPQPVEIESRSDGVEFDSALRGALGDATGRPGTEVVCFAGHDAGILAERVPAAMLLVRNENGISHAPDEDISVSDAAWGAQAILRALESLG